MAARLSSERTLEGWLNDRSPPAPLAARSLLEDPAMLGCPESAALDVLLAGGVSALRDALAGVGGRGGAFRLLAADAWVTYACERALEEDDPTTALRRIVDAVGVESREAVTRDG